jgi:hypothetical protein
VPDRTVQIVENKLKCLASKLSDGLLPVENLWKSSPKSIAQPFLINNFFQPDSNVFYKLRVICPQVFPQLSLREWGMGNGELGIGSK